MKRLLTSAAMFLCCVATSFAQFSGSGSGTESDPYLILNPIQLNQMRNFLNQNGVCFKLMADIDLTEFIEDEYGSWGWLPVGTSSNRFKGILDGNEKTVSGLFINRNETDNIGLFGYVDNATIKSLNLVSVDIKGKNYIGGFVGRGYATTILNCTLSGRISGNNYTGGYCGYGGDFTDCYSSANVYATGNYVGGICGSYASTTNCKVSNVVLKGRTALEGLLGKQAMLIVVVL